MDKSVAIQRLTVQLQETVARADWAQLERTARELGPQVQALAGHGAWSAHERAALARLRAAHASAAQSCAAAGARLEAQLAEMRDNKEGWMAYALAGEFDSGSTPP